MKIKVSSTQILIESAGDFIEKLDIASLPTYKWWWTFPFSNEVDTHNIDNVKASVNNEIYMLVGSFTQKSRKHRAFHFLNNIKIMIWSLLRTSEVCFWGHVFSSWVSYFHNFEWRELNSCKMSITSCLLYSTHLESFFFKNPKNHVC